MAYLLVSTPGTPPQRMKLEGAAVLGRTPDCQLWLEDRRLSRRHCRFERIDGRWFVEDLGSTNGTLINNRPIKRAPLRDGQSVEVGDTRLVFHADDYIAHRPTDPKEAARAERLVGGGDAGHADSTIIGRRLPHVPDLKRLSDSRVMPAPKPEGNGAEQPAAQKPRPLAFERPPAQPRVDPNQIVAGSDEDDAERRVAWLPNMLARLRRR